MPCTVNPLRFVVLLAASAVALLGGAPVQAGAAAVDPTVAPVTVVSADGRSGTDGVRTLALSQVAALDPAGAVVQVTGSGYDADKGIYVAFCVIPPVNHVPTPCGGGADTAGTAGAATWISSNPPASGVGLAQPYGPGGSFATSFTVRASISPTVDCRQVRCAVVTRNDHTRSADRSQDLILPVTFRTDAPAPTSPGGGTGGATAPTTAPGAAIPTTTASPLTIPPLASITTTAPLPVATVAADGRSVTDGVRTLAIDRTPALAEAGTTVTVTGSGFDRSRGIYVSLCALPIGGSAPGPCFADGPGTTAWVTASLPADGTGVAVPFGPDGTFTVELALRPEIDASTDCRTTPCAVVTRGDATTQDDRSLELALPVTFAASPAGGVGEATETEAAADGELAAATTQITTDTPRPFPTAVLVATFAGIALAVAAAVAVRRRRDSVDAAGSGNAP